MRNTVLMTLPLLASLISCGGGSGDVTGEIIALERAALDRWGNGDPGGFLDTYAPEVTYFDPFVDKRVDGLEAMKMWLAPFKGKIKIDRYEMIGAKVERHADVALLTYNFFSAGKSPDGAPTTAGWNCTEIYGRIDGRWRIIHNHWSLTKPELKGP